MWQLSRYRFEPSSSKIWTHRFQFYHIFSNSKTSKLNFWNGFDSMYKLHNPQMLKFMWVQIFRTNWSRGICKYKVEQLIIKFGLLINFWKISIFYMYILTQLLKIFFHDSNSKSNKTFFPWSKSCVGSNKLMSIWVWITRTWPWTLGF
jgi:hypothetical protein